MCVRRRRNQELAPELDYEYGEWVPVEAVMFNEDGSVSLLNAETDLEVVENRRRNQTRIGGPDGPLVFRFKSLEAAERWRLEAAEEGGETGYAVLLGDDGYFWLPATNRETGELRRMGYEMAIPRGNAQDDEPIEAYGVKGMKSTPWRKIFKNVDALNKWVEKNDAEVYGTRSVEK